MLYACALCLVLVIILLVLIVTTKIYRNEYFCSHIIGGYILLLVATLSQHASESHYSSHGIHEQAFLGIIFFSTSYLVFCWVYLWFYEDYQFGILRQNKEFLLLVIMFTVGLIVKKFKSLSLMLAYAILIGLFVGLCIICFLKKKALIRRIIINSARRVRNYWRPPRRRVYFVFPMNPGVEELNLTNHRNN